MDFAIKLRFIIYRFKQVVIKNYRNGQHFHFVCVLKCIVKHFSGSAGATKAAMELITGLRMGPPHLPQKPISDEAKNRLKENLIKLGFITQ